MMAMERMIEVAKQNSNMFSAEKVAYIGLLVALQIVLGNLVQIPLLSKQFNLGFLPIAVAGAMYGAPAAMIVGGLGDFFGVQLFPAGAYFFGFTLSSMLAGLLYGLVLYKRRSTLLQTVLAVFVVSVCYLFLNSYWLNMIIPTKTYWVWVGLRWWTYLIEIPLNATILYFTLRGLGKLKLPIFAALVRNGSPSVPKTDEQSHPKK